MKADSGNKTLQTVCEEAIEAGTDGNDMAFQTKVQVAIRDGEKLDSDNAALVETAADNMGVTLSDDDMKAAKAAGMTIEEYKKYMPKGDE